MGIGFYDMLLFAIHEEEGEEKDLPLHINWNEINFVRFRIWCKYVNWGMFCVGLGAIALYGGWYKGRGVFYEG